jgi:hypothetical protein
MFYVYDIDDARIIRMNFFSCGWKKFHPIYMCIIHILNTKHSCAKCKNPWKSDFSMISITKLWGGKFVMWHDMLLLFKPSCTLIHIFWNLNFWIMTIWSFFKINRLYGRFKVSIKKIKMYAKCILCLQHSKICLKELLKAPHVCVS